MPPRPYDIVAVKSAPPLADATFDEFRKALAAAAKVRRYADLTSLVTPQGFFWDRDFAQAYERRRPGVDNLAAAVGLERNDGAGWDALARFAAGAEVEAQEARPGTVCAPARPHFDVVLYARLLDRTFTTAADWAYPRAAKLAVRATPQPGGALVAELGAHFVRLRGSGGDGKATARDRWTEIVVPSGAPGYVAPGSLGSLAEPQLCFAKDALGRWHIVGFVAGG
ncbi:MAG: hypothetical protein FJX62_18580 [Alphaproteobacteria bacterium]|nr:hypothetical protein [Alphaproteobacteria bacterium]